MSKCLVLNFKNTDNKKMNIYIPSVRENINKEKILELMEIIFNSNELFEVDLKEVSGAFYIKGAGDKKEYIPIFKY